MTGINATPETWETLAATMQVSASAMLTAGILKKGLFKTKPGLKQKKLQDLRKWQQLLLRRRKQPLLLLLNLRSNKQQLRRLHSKPLLLFRRPLLTKLLPPKLLQLNRQLLMKEQPLLLLKLLKKPPISLLKKPLRKQPSTNKRLCKLPSMRRRPLKEPVLLMPRDLLWKLKKPCKLPTTSRPQLPCKPCC